VGWKIGGDIPEVDELTGGEPTIGHLTSASQLEPGASHSAAGAGALHADTEVVIEVGRDGKIAGLRVGLELVDLAHQAGDVEAIVAANVLHRAFAVGPPMPAVGAVAARSVVDGEVRARGRTAADHGRTLRTVAAQLEVLGERLRPGDLVFSGSVTQVPVTPGEEVAAEIDGLGRVSVTIAH
jgi:2-keto-4-pentenoate hydratase